MLKFIFTILASLLAVAAALPSGIVMKTDGADVVKRGVAGTTQPCATKAQKTNGDSGTGGRGVQLHNDDSQARSFYIYQNSCDLVPLKYISIGAKQTSFVSLPAGFQGRLVRGTDAVNLDGQAHTLGTWLELTYDGTGKGYADVSLIRGCDGAVTVRALDSSGAQTGFRKWLFDGAPADALEAKASGSRVIKATEDLVSAVLGGPTNFLAQQLGYDKAYIDDYHGNPVICSSNERFAATFYRGRP